MLGIKCKQCNNKFVSTYILLGEGKCVFCYHKIDKFYYNGDLLSKQEAIENNLKQESLIGKFKGE